MEEKCKLMVGKERNVRFDFCILQKNPLGGVLVPVEYFGATTEELVSE